MEYRLTVNVACHKNQSVQKMYLYYCYSPSNKILFLPCNGCDNSNGDAICNKCRALLTLKFNGGYSAKPGEIIHLDFSMLE